MDRANLQKEVSSLSSEIDRIAESANFNGIKLLNGDLAQKAANGVSGSEGDINMADGVTINAPVDGAGQKHQIDITIGGGQFNAGDEITLNVLDGTGSVKALTVKYGTGANEFSGDTMEDQAASIAQAINAKFGATTSGGTGDLDGYKATATMNAAGEMVISLTADAEGPGTLKMADEINNGVKPVQVTDKKVGVTEGAGSVDGKDPTGGGTVAKLGNTIKGIGYDGSGHAKNIQVGDKLEFTFNVNGKDQKVTLTATDQATTLGDNTFKVGNGLMLDDVVQNIAKALGSAQFNNNPLTGAVDESKLNVGDFFDVAANGNSLEVSVDANVKNNNAGKNYGFKDLSLTDVATTTTTSISSGTGKSNGLSIVGDRAGTAVALGSLQAGDTITITGTTQDGKSFEVTLKADATAAGANEFAFTGNATTDLNNIVTALKKSTTAVTIDGAGGGATGAMFDNTSASANFSIAVAGGQITFDAVGVIAPGKDKFEMEVKNSYNVGDKMTVRGVLSDGSQFSVELTASNSSGTLGANEFKIGDTMASTLENIKAALESANTKVKINDADSNVTGASIFTSTGSTTGEITIGTIAASATTMSFESKTDGIVGKGGASGVTSVTANASSDFVYGAEQKVAGKVAGNANNTLTFDASKIEQGTTLTINGNTYEFVTDAKYLSKDGDDGNTAVVVGNLGDGATDSDIAKALFETLTGTTALTTGESSATLNGSVDPGVANSGYNVKYSAGSGSIIIESIASGSGAVAIGDVAVSSGNRESSMVKFETKETGIGDNKKFGLNVKAGDSVTIDGKVYEFLEAGQRTKDENAIGVTLDFSRTDANVAKDAAKALADAVNKTTVAARDKSYNVLATANEDGSVNLVTRYNPNANEDDKQYGAPKVELPKSGGLTLQVGETSEDFQKVNVAIDKMDAKSLGIGDISVGKQEDAAAAIDKIKAAINTVSSTRGDLGAIQNRLEHTINNLGVTTENMTAAESRIRDTDMAKEMMEFTKNNILVQASQAMLAQANQLPQGVLQLLQ